MIDRSFGIMLDPPPPPFLGGPWKWTYFQHEIPNSPPVGGVRAPLNRFSRAPPTVTTALRFCEKAPFIIFVNFPSFRNTFVRSAVPRRGSRASNKSKLFTIISSRTSSAFFRGVSPPLLAGRLPPLFSSFPRVSRLVDFRFSSDKKKGKKSRVNLSAIFPYISVPFFFLRSQKKKKPTNVSSDVNESISARINFFFLRPSLGGR